ncbi:hypothetical protein CCM_00572 [Cordyceps militaris CM01]|uniref:Uncharacterized protein n=1 Tax=Cordyceps militaris (strain CM01) TaxID=983644 RepID=G3J4V1_CORMM|nr:uncharacterized protein CCM_00572 [Cordyceps militaris CM01]EGX95918.1 hypothetical protein CCM_00572 [Cordyceps militaris CM01]
MFEPVEGEAKPKPQRLFLHDDATKSAIHGQGFLGGRLARTLVSVYPVLWKLESKKNADATSTPARPPDERFASRGKKEAMQALRDMLGILWSGSLSPRQGQPRLDLHGGNGETDKGRRTREPWGRECSPTGNIRLLSLGGRCSSDKPSLPPSQPATSERETHTHTHAVAPARGATLFGGYMWRAAPGPPFGSPLQDFPLV